MISTIPGIVSTYFYIKIALMFYIQLYDSNLSKLGSWKSSQTSQLRKAIHREEEKLGSVEFMVSLSYL